MRLGLKNRALRAILYLGSALRIKHYRGHGVHSPFVYAIIRRALMKSRFTSEDRSLYNRLREQSCDRRSALQLQNLYNYCSYKNVFVADNKNVEESKPTTEQCMLIIMQSVGCEQTDRILTESLSAGIPVVVIYPRSDRCRLRICKRYVDSREYLSIDNRRFMIFYCDSRLPQQHFKL